MLVRSVNMDNEILKNILVRVGLRGLSVDYVAFQKEEVDLRAELASAQGRLNQEAGRAVVAHSSKDVGILLYEERGNRPFRTKTGQYSAAIAVLQLCSDPIVKTIIEVKSAQAKTKYLTVARKFLRSRDSGYYIPFQFEVDNCVTGRIYAKEPSVMSFPPNLRKCIIPEPGNEFIHADYDREELCILAYKCNDVDFLNDVKNGVDIFQELANMFDPDTREKVKLIIYAYFYGATVDSLASKTNMDQSVVLETIEVLRLRYPKLAAAPQLIIQEAEDKGYVETMIARRRYTINKENPDQDQELRRACNFVPQGTAGDILRRGIINIDAEGFDFKVSTHDSYLIEIPAGLPVDTQLREILTRDLPGALFVKIGRGRNWMEASGAKGEEIPDEAV